MNQDSLAREQTVTKSGIQGTGLGMAISKNIVNMMGGTITVNSEVGKGSEFIVSIECKITGETVKYKSVPELQGARALVVDDDANTCMSVCKMLRDVKLKRPEFFLVSCLFISWHFYCRFLMDSLKCLFSDFL